MISKVVAAYRTATAAVQRVVGGKPAYARRERRHVPVEVSNDAVESRRGRQPWLGVFFLALMIVGWWYPLVAFVGVVAMLAGAIGIGVFTGRYWCNWLCPRGSFFDSMLRLVSRGRTAPDWFHHPLFRLGWIVWFTIMVVRGVLPVWGDLAAMSQPFARLMVVSTAIAVVLGVVYHERAWCLFCPMGTMGNAANRLAKLLGRGVEPQVTVDGDACVNCLRCHSVCRQGIEPNEYKEPTVTDHGDVLDPIATRNGAERETADDAVDHGDCLKCGYCVEECPTGALSFEGAATYESEADD